MFIAHPYLQAGVYLHQYHSNWQLIPSWHQITCWWHHLQTPALPYYRLIKVFFILINFRKYSNFSFPKILYFIISLHDRMHEAGVYFVKFARDWQLNPCWHQLTWSQHHFQTPAFPCFGLILSYFYDLLLNNFSKEYFHYLEFSIEISNLIHRPHVASLQAGVYFDR